MTIYDIAKQAGVSASTVSRVINNKPGINAQTRKRVQKLLNENHYTPNEAARGLVMQSSKIIGILIEDLRIEHHTESAYVIEQEMTALGYTCITLSTGRRDEKKADYIRILEQRRVDGAILMGSMFETEAVKKSIKEHLPDVPVAIVNGYLDLPNVYGILIDEERGVKDCAELMFKKGKKHLVMAVDSDTPSNRNKQKGYLRAMLEQGIAKEDIPFYTAVNKEFTNPRDVRAAGAKLTEQILTERPETDGIIYTTDLLAVGGLEAAKKMGKRIPQDLAIMGIDNTMYGEIVTPKLSSLDNKLVEVSQNASRAILDALDKKEVSHKVMLLTDIKERETTYHLPKAKVIDSFLQMPCIKKKRFFQKEPFSFNNTEIDCKKSNSKKV